MSSDEITKRLTAKAVEAEATIQYLRSKISEIKVVAQNKVFKVEESRLREENERFSSEIESMKKRLDEIENQNGKLHVPKIDPAAGVGQEVKIEANVISEPNKTDNSAVEKSETKSPKPTKEKKAKNNVKKPAEDDVPIDIRRLDFRVGKILSAEKHPDADSLYVEQVDVGEENPRTVVSGLVKFIPLEQMENRMAVLMCNLKPAKMRGVVSQAMVMCASTPEKVEILSPPEGCTPGDLIEFEGYPCGVADAQLNPKKKIWEQVSPDLKTDNNMVATYKGVPFTIPGKGVVRAETLANVLKPNKTNTELTKESHHSLLISPNYCWRALSSLFVFKQLQLTVHMLKADQIHFYYKNPVILQTGQLRNDVHKRMLPLQLRREGFTTFREIGELIHTDLL
ncbi:Aminoacyl tRNA synthase complex-interacting multifunctional protein 1 [Nymphon striatum]|nr:Aminoacyl tRNA synthase complex-interacting multifunctional protein 1 [Nymphon striatum]